MSVIRHCAHAALNAAHPGIVARAVQCLTLPAQLLPILNEAIRPKRRIGADFTFQHHCADSGIGSPVGSLVDQPSIPRERTTEVAPAVRPDGVERRACRVERGALVRQFLQPLRAHFQDVSRRAGITLDCQRQHRRRVRLRRDLKFETVEHSPRSGGWSRGQPLARRNRCRRQGDRASVGEVSGERPRHPVDEAALAWPAFRRKPPSQSPIAFPCPRRRPCVAPRKQLATNRAQQCSSAVHVTHNLEQGVGETHLHFRFADTAPPRDFAIWKIVAASQHEDGARQQRKRFERLGKPALVVFGRLGIAVSHDDRSTRAGGDAR